VFRFLCCHLVVVTFGLLVPAEWSVGKTGFCVSQVVIGCEDCLKMTNSMLNGTLNPRCTIPYQCSCLACSISVYFL